MLELNKMKEAQCPICAARNVSSFFLKENAIVQQQFIMATREEAQKCKRGKIELALCGNCGTIWNVAFDPRLLEYSERYEATQMSSPTFQRYASHIAKYLIQKYALLGKNIIEIGAGNGYFLRLLCQLGNNHGIGFEPSWRPENGMADMPDTVKIIPDYYSDRYAECLADLICCRHVLEHVQDPITFLQDIKRFSGPNRPVFFFEVPNVTWSLRKLAFWDLYYEHSFYFSRPSLNYLFAACRLNVQQIRKDSADNTCGQRVSLDLGNGWHTALLMSRVKSTRLLRGEVLFSKLSKNDRPNVAKSQCTNPK